MPSANLEPEAPAKPTGGKRNRQQKQAKRDRGDGAGSSRAASKSNKSLVDELKLFQNSNLLNQQDPLEQLHQQINRLIEDDGVSRRLERIPVGSQHPAALPDSRLKEAHSSANSQPSNVSVPPVQYQDQSAPQKQQLRFHANMPAINFHPNQASPYYASHQEVFTVKKGVLWEQQHHERFHQRLFSRWKKRYFILTTDYLVCFKRSSSKVGRSEMGKFLYKIALTDVINTEWLRPKRSDKGPIIMHVKNRFDLMLWAKKESEEWMMLINESIERLRIRKTIIANGQHTSHAPQMTGKSHESQTQDFHQGLYENAFASREQNGDIDTIENGHPRQQSARIDSALAESMEPADSRQAMRELTTGSTRTKASSRASSGSRRHPNEPTAPAAPTTNEEAALLASSESEPNECMKLGDKEAAIGQADANASCSLEQTLRTDRQHSEEAVELVTAEGSCAARAESESTQRGPSGTTIDKITISHGQSSGAGERRHELAAAGARDADKRERVAGRRSDRLESRPVAKLIRRDDSWHSLVSLTHVGESTMPAGQKESLHAPHIIGRGANDGANALAGQTAGQRRAIRIDSTATPLRAAGRLGPTRQHSIQSQTRRLPPLGVQENARSLDVPGPIASSPSLQGGANQQQRGALHHQRLLQLQLLHNSNNVDYIRANNDYQIYGPESVATTNHYGYYSMRSNLKSAASEFSFIRPSSSSFQQGHLATPMHSGPLMAHKSGLASEQPAGGREPPAKLPAPGQNQLRLDHNNNFAGAPLNLAQSSAQLRQDYGAVSSRMTDQAQLSGAPMAPNRELPLKPNKRRQAKHQEADKSSHGSGIVSFLRRAFSRRSKRRSKRLVESCSSSLAAFDSNLDQIHVAQSAFSTGNKSARADRAPVGGPVNGQQQQQRMIDLIEAFTSKTALDQGRPVRLGNLVASHQPPPVGDPNQFGSIRPKFIRDQQLGSPLHKSNSISATSGLGGLNELAVYRDQRALAAENGTGAFQAPGELASPLIGRSSNVMGANLTPLFAQKSAREQLSGEDAMSARSARHLPRPSSIYGQPSMIGSPVIAASARTGPAGEFGLHRNSMHAGSGQHRDRFSKVDFRRQRAINGPSLDTTREVAEELASPTSELQRELLPNEQLYDHEINARFSYNPQDASSLMRTPKLAAAYYGHQQRQAVVNPILQSPTINTVYDNHSSASANHRLNEIQHHLQHQSLYDNHRGVSSIHDPDRDASGYSRPQLMIPAHMDEERLKGAFASPMIHRNRSTQAFVNHPNAFCTPTRECPRQNQLVRSATSEGNRVFVRSKPAAIVAPTTPHRQSANLTRHFEPQFNSPVDSLVQEHSAARFIGHQASPMRTQQTAPNAAVVSPIASRHHSINQPQPLYQKSSLLDEQTRILKRGGRVQSTIIASDHSESTHSEPDYSRRESSVLRDLGINPSAEGLPNVRPNEVGAQPNNKPSSVQPQARPQTSRLSSERDEDESENENGNAPTRAADKQSSDSGRSFEPVTQSPSTGSRSANSSASRRSGSGSSATDSHSDAPETNKTEWKTASQKSATKQGRPNGSSHSQASQSSGSKHPGSSSHLSDELSSRAGSFDDHDEKNWINSKLVQ